MLILFGLLAFLVESDCDSVQGGRGCRCVNNNEAVTQLKEKYKYKRMDGQTVSVAHPEDWGTRCEAWDEKDCNTTWCKLPYCLVEGDCNLKYHPYPHSSHSGLHYSFTTCGGVDYFNHYSYVTGKTFRVTYIAQNPPYVFDTLDLKNTSAGGLAAGVLAYLERETNTTMVVSRSTHDKAGTLDEYEKCIQMIQNGSTDLCCCNYWDSIDRLDTIMVPIFLSPFAFLVETKGRPSISHLAGPFSNQLWVVIIGALVLTVLLQVVVESHNIFEFREGGGRPKRWLWNGFHSAYLVTTGLLSTGVIYKPISPAGKILSMGMSTFFLLITASYTANLAAFLVVNHLTPKVEKIEDILEKRGNVCAWSGTATIRAQWPTLGIVELFSYNQSMQYLEDETCYGVVDESLFWKYAITYNKPPPGLDHFDPCSKTVISDILETVHVGLRAGNTPAGQALAFFAAIRSQVADGAWADLRSYYDQPGQVKCYTGDLDSMTWVELRGGFLLLASAACLAMFLYILEQIYTKHKKHQEHKQQCEETNHTPLSAKMQPPETSSPLVRDRVTQQSELKPLYVVMSDNSIVPLNAPKQDKKHK